MKSQCKYYFKFLFLFVVFITGGCVIANDNFPDDGNKYEYTMNFEVPCLTVRGTGESGKLSYLPFRFQKTNEDKPLRIAVIDDTPNGSGEEIRSNLWLAAVTAAMLRSDTLHGVRLTVEFQGNVDGPSAGAVSCLAILSAMDGVSLPEDFAMTGAIFPDGSIGAVGGIVEKMKAAAKSGKKRVLIPGGQRIEYDSNGKLVDLRRLAEQLDVAVYPVENIEEAYAIVHKKTYSGNKYIDVKKVTALSKATEEVLVNEFYKYRDRIPEVFKELPEKCKDFVAEVYKEELNYDRLFREGKFLAACEQVVTAYQLIFLTGKHWEKFTQWYSFSINKNKKLSKIYNENIEYAKKKIEEQKKTRQAEFYSRYGTERYRGFVPNEIGLSPITAQFEEIEDIPAVLAIWQMLDDKYKEVQKTSISDEDFNGFLVLGLLHRCGTDIFASSTKEYIDFCVKISKTITNIQPNEVRSAKVENLFRTAMMATGQTAYAMLSRIDNLEYNSNIDMYITYSLQRQAIDIHEEISSSTFKNYHTQVSLKSQISAFVNGAALLIKSYENSSTDFIKKLTRSARANALKNMYECVEAGVPCIDSIRAFQQAESNEDQQNQIEVLKNYWYAGLYAKALMICFK